MSPPRFTQTLNPPFTANSRALFGRAPNLGKGLREIMRSRLSKFTASGLIIARELEIITHAKSNFTFHLVILTRS